MRPLGEIRHDAEEAHLTGSLGKTSYSLLFDVPALCDEVERLRAALQTAAGRFGYLSTALSCSNKPSNAKSALEWSEEARAFAEEG